MEEDSKEKSRQHEIKNPLGWIAAYLLEEMEDDLK